MQRITHLKRQSFISLQTIKTPHLVSQYKERNHLKTEEPTVARPAGEHVGSAAPSPATLQHQLDTSVKHLPSGKLGPKDQTWGGALSPGQCSNSSPLKTLGNSNPDSPRQKDRSGAASAIKGFAKGGGPAVRLLRNQLERLAGREGRWRGGKSDLRNLHFNYNQTPAWC